MAVFGEFLGLLRKIGTEENGMRKIGLVLGGGAVRGLAHLGVLKGLEKHEIPVAGIIGTSMGGAIGGLYAAGISAGDIERMLLRTPSIALSISVLDSGACWQGTVFRRR